MTKKTPARDQDAKQPFHTTRPLNKLLVVILFAGAVLWIGSGLFSKAPYEKEAENTSAKATTPQNAIHVVTQTTEIVEHAPIISISGITKAEQKVTVLSEISSRVIDITAQKGQSIKAGTLIARLKDDGRRAAFDEAQVILKQRETELKRAETLRKSGTIAQSVLDERKSALARAQKQLEQAKAALEKVELTAPFDAILDTLPLDPGQVVQVGTPLYTLVKLDKIIVSAEVSERNVGKIKLGQTIRARFLSHPEATGTLTFISKSASPETRTFPIEATIENPTHTISDGLTTELEISLNSQKLARIPRSALTLNNEGALGIKTVKDKQVVFKSIEVKDDGWEYLFVSGLQEGDEIIVRGQDFVAHGETVTATPLPQKKSPQTKNDKINTSFAPQDVLSKTVELKDGELPQPNPRQEP